MRRGDALKYCLHRARVIYSRAENLMSLLIKNGEIITASDRYVADILCEGETITRIGRNLSAPAGRRSDRRQRASTSSPASSIRTCTSTCRSWARSRRTTTTPAAGPRSSAARRRSSKCAARARQDEPLAGFELWMSQGRRQLGLRLHVPHGRVAVRRRRPKSSSARS